MTATCHQRSHAEYREAIPAIAEQLAASLEAIDPSARVPTCPDWSVAGLGEHVGSIHRWATQMVAVASSERISARSLDLGVPDDPRGLPDWVRAGVEPLIAALRSVDPDAPMWAWGSDKHARFWSRRMVHETAVHGADAEFAAGVRPVVDAAIAIDGIDEFLDNLPHAVYFAPRVAELRGTGDVLALVEPSSGTQWTITLRPDDFVWDHTEVDAGVTVEGSASDLLLLAYGRLTPDDGGRFRITGDRALLDFWRERSSI
jgi:uncharacterized protein (TIGR03083 family)